jgi:hypothetical protein
MVTETPYTFENWYTPTELNEVPASARYYQSDTLAVFLGSARILVFEQDEDYHGDWAAFVTDGNRIGLVEGSFGSCDSCDWLMGCVTLADYAEWAAEHLKAVRTFSFWDGVVTYLRGLDADKAWAFRGMRAMLATFAEVRLPLGAADIFMTLFADNPQAGAVHAAMLASAVHRP